MRADKVMCTLLRCANTLLVLGRHAVPRNGAWGAAKVWLLVHVNLWMLYLLRFSAPPRGGPSQRVLPAGARANRKPAEARVAWSSMPTRELLLAPVQPIVRTRRALRLSSLSHPLLVGRNACI